MNKFLLWEKSSGLGKCRLLIPSGNPCDGFLLVCQARSAKHLQLFVENQKEFLNNNSQNISLSNPSVSASYINNSCKKGNRCDNLEDDQNIHDLKPCSYNAVFSGSDFHTLFEHLLKYSQSTKPNPFLSLGIPTRKRIAMLFTGQSSQYPGMAKQLHTTSRIFREAFDRASSVLNNAYGLKVNEAVYGEQNHVLDTSLYSQTSIFCLEVGMLAFWKSFGVEPCFVLGPSAGGFAAAVAAEALTIEEGALLVGGRACLINSLPEGGMMAVEASETKVQALLDQMVTSSRNEMYLDVAVINSYNDVVVAGRPSCLDTFEKLCVMKGLKTSRLKAKQAFHSREIDSIFSKYVEILDSIGLKSNVKGSACGYISGINGAVMSGSDFTKEYWLAHARAKVDLPAAVTSLWNQGVRVFVEVGPRPVLLHDGRAILGEKKASEALWIPSITKPSEDCKTTNWDTVLEGLGRLFEAGIVEFDPVA